MYRWILAGLFVCFLFCGSVFANDGIAIVKQVEGSVTVKRAGEALPVAQGDRLLEGDILITGGDGHIGVIFHDGSILSLGEKSFLRVENFVFKPIESEFKFHLDLKKGTALFESGKIGALSPEDFSFKVPEGTIGIRGTKFLVEVR